MNLDSADFEYTANQFRKFTEFNRLPRWDDLPPLELYMDQIVVLINRYLDFFSNEDSGDKIITPAMINNYVKMKTIPMPVKKKYSRVHLACLIMVCALKQSLNIATIENLIPNNDSEENVKAVYDSFVENWEKSFSSATQQIISCADEFRRERSFEKVDELVVQIAVRANVFKIFAEKMISVSASAKSDSDTAEKDKPKSKKKAVEVTADEN